MKKVFILVLLVIFSFPLISEEKDSITKYYNNSLDELIPNKAKKSSLGTLIYYQKRSAILILQY